MSYADTVLLGKLAIGIACAASLVLLRHPWLASLSRGDFDRLTFALLLGTRLGLCVLLFWVLDYPVMGDLRKYVDEGRSALLGGLVYRDFRSSYAPLFPYGVAAVLSVWDSGKALLLFAIAIEAASLGFWLAGARRLLGEPEARCAALLYVASPIALLNVAMHGHNNVWVSLWLAASVFALARPATSGALAGLALATTKLLAAIFAPIVWLFAARQLRFLLGFGALAGAVYGAALAIAGADALYPITYQALRVTPGGLLFLGSAFGLDLEDRTVLLGSTLFTAVSLVGLFAIAWIRGVGRHPQNLFPMLALVLLVFLLASKKSYTTYLVMALFPLCACIAMRGPGRAALLGYALLGVLGSVDITLWFRWAATLDLSLLRRDTLPEGLHYGRLLAFAGVEALLVGLYAAFAVAAWRSLMRGSPGPRDLTADCPLR